MYLNLTQPYAYRAELDVLKSGKLTAEVTDTIRKVVADLSKNYAE